MGWVYVSELRPSMRLLLIPQDMYEYGEPRWNYTDRWKPKISEKTWPRATLSPTNPAWTGQWSHFVLLYMKAWPWLKRLVAGLPPRGPVSRPVRSMWDLWWSKWHWGRFFSEFFGFPLSISFRHCSTLINHRPMRCVIALTTQHIITTSVLS
jgi:hypothetical protein